eukprot:11910424-Alexandrium_andersonii.AAC.1
MTRSARRAAARPMPLAKWRLTGRLARRVRRRPEGSSHAWRPPGPPPGWTSTASRPPTTHGQ